MSKKVITEGGKKAEILSVALQLFLKNGYEKTSVIFDKMTNDVIDEYIKSGEPFDKAGAYGIQGAASKYIKGISGCYFNVVGLPIHLTYNLLLKALANN